MNWYRWSKIVIGILVIALGFNMKSVLGQDDIQPPSLEGNWQLVFHDEFDGTGVDDAKWVTCYWWDYEGCTNLGNNELEWYQPYEVIVDDGILRLRAHRRNVETPNLGEYEYTSGMVTTGRNTSDTDVDPKFIFRYGYVEVRAKVPSGQGLWPAIWLLPDDQTSKPEIDIMEILGHEPNIVNLTMHYQDSDDEDQRFKTEWTGPDFSQDWHVYSINWEPNQVTWYVDGVERFQVTDTQDILVKDMYLLINLAVGGDWAGPPDENTVLPNYFKIDYVRIWQNN